MVADMGGGSNLPAPQQPLEHMSSTDCLLPSWPERNNQDRPATLGKRSHTLSSR